MLSVRDDIILVGKDTQIYCEIDLIGVILGSDVAINVTWFRDNITLTNSTISGLTTGATDVHSTLTFNSVHLSDMAIYGCYVTLTPLLGSASPVTASDILLLAVAGKWYITCIDWSLYLTVPYRASQPSKTRASHGQKY